MHRIARDIRSLTHFRANAATLVEQVQSTHEPLILTQHGRGVAVLLGVAAYEELIDELALVRDVRTAEAQADRQNVIPRELAEAHLRAVFGR